MHGSSSPSTSSSLIRQVQASDPVAWSRLARLYTPLAFGWCRRAGLQDADIADILQNVFTSVHRGVGQFRPIDGNSSFRGWLWTITRNEIRLHLRRRAAQPQAAGGTDARQALDQWPDVLNCDQAPADDAAQAQLARRALRMIQAEFTPPTWQAFWRTTIDDCPASEVADELGLTPQAVRQAKYRVLVRLRAFLADG